MRVLVRWKFYIIIVSINRWEVCDNQWRNRDRGHSTGPAYRAGKDMEEWEEKKEGEGKKKEKREKTCERKEWEHIGHA